MQYNQDNTKPISFLAFKEKQNKTINECAQAYLSNLQYCFSFDDKPFFSEAIPKQEIEKHILDWGRSTFGEASKECKIISSMMSNFYHMLFYIKEWTHGLEEVISNLQIFEKILIIEVTEAFITDKKTAKIIKEVSEQYAVESLERMFLETKNFAYMFLESLNIIKKYQERFDIHETYMVRTIEERYLFFSKEYNEYIKKTRPLLESKETIQNRFLIGLSPMPLNLVAFEEMLGNNIVDLFGVFAKNLFNPDASINFAEVHEIASQPLENINIGDLLSSLAQIKKTLDAQSHDIIAATENG